ncbi:MAG: PIN domain-containing protein [Nitrospirae bacterium]|nr:PIN domain-containing protein [Nitrospirota bacterium]
MQISAPLKKLAADANVILSAIAGKAALRVFLKEDIEIATTEFNIEEVREYISVISKRYELSEEILESQLKLLPLKIHPRHFYEDQIQKASKKMSDRDEDDIELLALAMKLKIPVWSNDKDFQHSGIEVYTTAKLLNILKA